MAPTFYTLARLTSALVLLTLFSGWTMVAFAEVIEEDDGLPSTVENVQAFPGDESVDLTWDAATDDQGVEGYYVYVGIKSVETEGGSYGFGSTDVGNSTSTTVENLSNGTTYYFAITAYDEGGNESEYYSNEVEATPEASELGDFTAPTVTDAVALTNTLVQVTFSEAIELPSDPTSAFSIIAEDGTAIQVIDTYLAEDATTVFVVTEEQEDGVEYELTAGIGITDLAGNPVESGTSDLAYFTGSGLQKTEGGTGDDTPSTDEEFTVSEVEATESNELVLTFTKDLASAEADSFIIQLADDASQQVEVLAVSIDDEEKNKITLVTEEMGAGYEYVLTMDETVFSADGATLLEENQSVTFTAKTIDLADLLPPEDVTDFLSEIVNESTVELTWTASENSAGDLAQYLIYQSMDGGLSFEEILELAADAVSTEIDGLTPGETYTFKVTAVDENGNESEGVMTTVTLPESGPELFVLGGLSLLGALLRRRKRAE